MIAIKNITKSFGENVLFRDYSLTIPQGAFCFFTGASGCGKTTLLNMIGSLEPVDSGEIFVKGKNIANKKNQTEYLKFVAGFLFQNFALIDDKTVKENLALIKDACRSGVTVQEALDFVGLGDKLDQKVFSLSGGEQQRVALARLMLKKCELILADEPTGSLDKKNAALVFELLRKLHGQEKTVVVVSHDQSFIAQTDLNISLESNIL